MGLKTSSRGILLPGLIALLVPLRMSLAKFFDHALLEPLDPEEAEEAAEHASPLTDAHR